jgi:predicted DNA-binding transcriptional regulator YafY
LPDLWGDEVELRSEKNDGEYVLYRAGEYWRGWEINDRNERDFFPIFQAFNRQKTLSPKPVPEMEKRLKELLDFDSDESQRVVFKSTFPWSFPTEYMTTFLDAIHSKKAITVQPRGESRKVLTATPLFLINCDGSWHLVAQRNVFLLQYNLSRVDSLTLSEEDAELVSRADLAKLRNQILSVFGSNFVSASEEGAKLVTVAFRGIAYPYAQERFPGKRGSEGGLWYETEVSKDEVRVRLRVNAPWELISELLRWGEDAEAIEPEDFREAWLERASLG